MILLSKYREVLLTRGKGYNERAYYRSRADGDTIHRNRSINEEKVNKKLAKGKPKNTI